jgi:nitrogen regulatory protein PII
VLHTDNIGVGRIFITDVENIVRVRTREVGCVAL